MIRATLLTTLYVFVSFIIKAQKSSVDLDAIDYWKRTTIAKVSSNGNFSSYSYISEKEKGIVIKSISGKWQVEIKNALTPFISDDNKFCIYEMPDGNIEFFNLNLRKVVFKEVGVQLKEIRHKTGFIYSWLKPRGNNKFDMLLLDSKTHHRQIYHSVISYYFSDSGQSLIMVTSESKNNFRLKWINVANNTEINSWSGNSVPKGVKCNNNDSRIAFFIDDTIKASKIIILEQKGHFRKICKDDLQQGFMISSQVLNFNKNGNKLFFSVLKYEKDEEKVSTVGLNVWNYQDIKIQSEQLAELNENRLIVSVLNFANDSIHVLPLENDQTYLFDAWRPNVDVNGYYLTREFRQKPNELQVAFVIGSEFKSNIYLNDITNAENRILIASGGYFTDIRFSPNGKFIVYFNQISKQYYSYFIRTGTTYNITSKVPFSVCTRTREEERFPLQMPAGIAGWSADDKFLYIYDQYDIWRIDLFGQTEPICVTKGYGRINQLELRLKDISGKMFGNNLIKRGDTFMIFGKKINNYEEGHILIRFNKTIELNGLNLYPEKNWIIEKSNDKYLILKSSNQHMSNWYFTKDFKNFTNISDLAPQKHLRWFNKQLINFRTLDGKWAKGVLFKPDDFDSSKRYPIIFNFYERYSDKIFEYDQPKLSPGAINPPWMVSREYLVFQPDINFTFGSPGESALNYVVGAAKYFCKKNWIDSARMGLSGASHGAFSVNYIISRTKMFAAAAAAFGMVDMISGYGSLIRNAYSRQSLYEASQDRIGASLWERPELFINNSAIFRADSVNTPVLILHNQDDPAVPWAQGLEWYLALRRLGKRVWMLQYDNEGHGLSEKENMVDYTQRLEQFFDYYLKDAPPPKWITKGIPAKMKGIDSGLELDPSGAQP